MLLWLGWIALPLMGLAQHDPGTLRARYISADIVVDGIMAEAAWQTADSISDFWQYFPTDSVRARNRTSVRILYDDQNLYVGIYAESAESEYVATSLRRDFSGASNDNVSVLFDTFRDGANAFLFGITPYGVQREVLISEGGTQRGFNPAWDMKWRGEVTRHEGYFVAEMAIPLTSMKFPEGAEAWRFQAYRFDYQNQEQSAWARVPQNQLLSSIAFMGTLAFEKPLGKSRTPFALIPYVNVLARDNALADVSDVSFKAGGDAKVAIGNGMNLDVTINPDFSNAEVDAIFTNLTRFELFLPERRQFFIDNSDLFGSFGSIYNDASPFFSRRIGLARDTAGNLIQNRIIAGARLSGKLDENWRLGVLNIQTGEDLPNEIAGNNNLMLALQRKVSARSSIGAFFINRQTFQDYDFLAPEDAYNRVYGIDYTLASRDNRWTGKFYAHQSLQPDDQQGNLSAQATVAYNDRFWYFSADLVHVDQDFRSDLGFIPRRDIVKYGMGAGRTFYPKGGIVNKHVFRLISLTFWRPSLDFQRTDQLWRPEYTLEFRNQSKLELQYQDQYIFLTNDFNPTGKAGPPIPGNTGYDFNRLEATYTSNVTRPFTYGLRTTLGQFFNGSAYSYGLTLGYRLQPFASFSLEAQYDRIRLPGDIPDADFWLITPRLEITFSRSIFWTTTLQYSNQRDNLGINSRLQWRFAPLSDLFLVYNDNYFPNGWGPKFRSINLKLSYWLTPGGIGR
ncbi:MAG: hydrolase [Bacteroidetes bacterium]|nr:MAG: hydrolase [Bacteroidota bacterium]